MVGAASEHIISAQNGSSQIHLLKSNELMDGDLKFQDDEEGYSS